MTTATLPPTYARPVSSGGVPLACTMADVRRSPLVDLLAAASAPDVISFAVGLPAAELFPGAAIAESCVRVAARSGALQYGVPSAGLKRRIVELMARRGVRCRESQVFLTSGAQQAMDLIVRLLLDPGGEVMIEDVVYEGIRLAMRPADPRIVTVPSSPETGLDVDAVERLLEGGARPALLYVIPEGHNPLGASLDLESRRRLAGLARQYQMPILEDDAYGLLSFGESPPALRALDEDWVFYLGSFSKILAPALRVGWIVAPEDLHARLSALKHGMDVDTSTFVQHVLCDHLDTADLSVHLETLRSSYRERRDALVAALARYAPPGLRWWAPAGGFYLWVELPEGFDAARLLRRALAEERVAFTPGSVFALPGHPWAARCFRMSFAGTAVGEIEEGVRRLAAVLTRSPGEKAVLLQLGHDI